MNDFYEEYRSNMIETMQKSLKQIRQTLGIKVQDFGEYLGVSRQSINNLETQKNYMSVSQYLAVASLLDFKFKENPDCYGWVISILKNNDTSKTRSTFNNIEMDSLTRKWFLCFPGNEPEFAGADETFSDSELEKLVSIYRVMVDDSIFMAEGGIQAVERIACAMQVQKRKFVLPNRVEESLRHQLEAENPDLRQKAQEAMSCLKALNEQGSLALFGSIGDADVYNTLASVLKGKKGGTRMAILTANQAMADYVHELNNPASECPGFNILALKSDPEGNVAIWPCLEDSVLDEDCEKEEGSSFGKSEGFISWTDF